jgi:aminoglycoside phosphotransferase (APT) family kinase protein
LPFKITNLVGETKDSRGQRALIFEFVYGNPIEAGSVSPQSSLALSMGESIAAIHNLPLSVVQEAHLAEFEPADIISARVADLDRAAATGRVPSALLSRWEAALEDVNLFRFQPSVIHGSLGTDTALELDGLVSGVLAWSSLKISDPAEDLAWIVGAGNHELTDTVLTRYGQLRATVDATIRQRATLYSELEMAKWLVHGVNKGNQGIIDDAMGMLNVLAEDVDSGAIGKLVAAPLVAATAAIIASEVIELEEVELEVIELEEVELEEVELEVITSEPVDLATRPIELPEKSEDELF